MARRKPTAEPRVLWEEGELSPRRLTRTGCNPHAHMLAYLAQPAADGRGNRREPRRGLRVGNTASPVTGQVIILLARCHAPALNGDCKHFGELCAVNGVAHAVALLERRKPRANVTCP